MRNFQKCCTPQIKITLTSNTHLIEIAWVMMSPYYRTGKNSSCGFNIMEATKESVLHIMISLKLQFFNDNTFPFHSLIAELNQLGDCD